MQTTIESKKPELRLYGIPLWCHHHCGKMQLERVENSACKIAGSAASVEIGTPHLSTNGKRYWRVSWEVIWNIAREEKVSGRVSFSDSHLRAAFGLSEENGAGGEWLLKEYGGDVAAQGLFIRYQQFLNVPGPGTGHDGDPNISIELTEQMKNAVASLLLAKCDPVAAN